MNRRNSFLPANEVFNALGRWVLLCIVAGALLRILLLFHPITVTSSLGFGQWLGLFALGIVNDACIGVLSAIPLACFWMSSGHWKLGKPQCYVFIAALIVAWWYLTYACRPLWEFNKPLARILSWVMVAWIVAFALRAFVPKLRRWWMMSWTAIMLFIYLGLLVLNMVGEWFFWNEYGVRYNFIAVDYLVYTNEVIGNIMQSYSMGWIISAVVLVTLILEIWLFRKVIRDSADFYLSGWRFRIGASMAAGSAVALIVLPLSERAQNSENAWYNGLQANGVYCFVKAFSGNELDYDDFYLICPTDELVQKPFRQHFCTDSDSVASPALIPNIVMITMESMSADYMSHFGNDENLTPVLDSLWQRSIVFDRMFAAGNRTVRGLEALVLSRPPSPGESIIKRPNNTGYPSIADNLHAMGYDMAFYYGGNSYFDNMKSFFTGLGYNIHDRKTMPSDAITCQTVWGVCDGNVYRRVIADMDSAASGAHPVLAHILTTSNHRPYIYPDSCVSIPPSKQSRSGAVMYSDYALGQFLKEASAKPWFDNTVFVISADHCASSAGSTELPLGNYHIPALIYAPSMFQPMTVDKVASQIDIMPTLFALLNWDCNSNLYGENVLCPEYKPRAYLATYQDMGYLKNDTLTVLSPGRKYRQFAWEPTADDAFATVPIHTPDLPLIYEAASLYQESGSKQ